MPSAPSKKQLHHRPKPTRGAQPEGRGARGSDNLPTDQLMEGLTRMFEAMQGKAEKRQQCAAAITTQTGKLVFGQASMRMPETFDGSFKVGEDPQQKVLVFTSQMNSYIGQQRCSEAVGSLTLIKFGRPRVRGAPIRCCGDVTIDRTARKLWPLYWNRARGDEHVGPRLTQDMFFPGCFESDFAWSSTPILHDSDGTRTYTSSHREEEPQAAA